MELEVAVNEKLMEIQCKGMLDSVTAPQLGDVIEKIDDGVENLVLDLKELNYISSAGLRVMLVAEKKMKLRGGMIVRNVNDAVMEILSITGFDKILTIE